MEYDIDDPVPFVKAPLINEEWWHRTAEYRTVFRLTFPTQIFWMAVYLFLFLVVAPKVYGHEIEESGGVVCDTKEQITVFADLDARVEAIPIINADAPNACVMAQVAYIKGQTIKQVHNANGAMEVVEILVLAFKLHGQWMKIEPPSIQYTLFSVVEEGA